jgi:hypothetical protein
MITMKAHCGGFRIGGAGLLGLLFMLGGCRTKAPAQNATLLWKSDLTTDPGFRQRLKTASVLLRPPTLDFLTNGQLILSFDDGTTSDPAAPLLPFGFHVLMVDSTTGKPGQSLSVPVTVDMAQARPIAEGGFLVLANEELARYSNDLVKVSSMPTPLRLHGLPTVIITNGRPYANPRYERWQMDLAPSGKTVMLEHTVKPQQLELQWRKTADFSLIQSMSMGTHIHIAAGSRSVVVDDFLSPVAKGSWLRVSPSESLRFCQGCYSVSYISDDLLFESTKDRFQIKDLRDQVLLSGGLAVDAESFSRSLDATRFVYATGGYEGHGFPIKTEFPSVHAEIRVVDWTTMKQVSEVRLQKKVGAVSSGYKQSALALSPDGKKLAILDDSTLSCYSLP